ncbi:hypothetical protein PROFUN_01684 [Planoprotostelium fungivorum]|uniref:Uncharacterized protein n=1 Tax=Planoprotostelium fungivorum TaxID=1890364 RepID=A0A2P6MW79_9EUKA|nr:hypothetical protein PROFUN_01684 [Planoprotostelium fungivorum]
MRSVSTSKRARLWWSDSPVVKNERGCWACKNVPAMYLNISSHPKRHKVELGTTVGTMRRRL